jgi:hypothetical protein
LSARRKLRTGLATVRSARRAKTKTVLVVVVMVVIVKKAPAFAPAPRTVTRLSFLL